MTNSQPTDADAIKKELSAHVEHALAQNGGVAALAERAAAIPGTVTFVAGYVCGLVACARYVRAYGAGQRGASVVDTGLSHEEVRRVHDMVRLAIEAGATTS